MVRSRLDDRVVWLVVEGELSAAEMTAETEKWLLKKDAFAGFITDIRKMTGNSAAEQKKIEERRKQNQSGKPNAILGKDDAMSVLVAIYIRFTRASDTRYFTDPEKAKAWLKSYK